MDWLQEIYGGLNRSLFGGSLPKVSFEINTSRKTIFHFDPPATVEVGTGMATANVPDILDDLVHSMVHMRNYQLGVPDHVGNQYHNQHFMEVALGLGLYVCQHKSRGWALTYSSEADTKTCKGVKAPQPKDNDNLRAALASVKIPRRALGDLQRGVAKAMSNKSSKQYLLKYTCQCPAPYNTIRSGRRPNGAHPLDITCNLCGQKFVVARK